tara:strand:- start:15 stop:314 length:300 start_codon:yes stop_codon:yes gene_type:complete
MNIENDKEGRKIYLSNIFFVSLIIYFLYLEINPKIRGIWLRKGDDNKLMITFNGLKNFIMYPIKDIRMWFPKMWDMNIFISVPILSCISYNIIDYWNRL